jgi:hypothetical protein
MMTAVEEDVYRAVHITADKLVEFLVRLSNAETEVTTWCMADMNCIVSQLEREIYGITSNKQMPFKTEFSIHLMEFEAWW